MKPLSSFLILVLFSSSSARAMVIDYIEIECDPQRNLFKVEYFGSEDEQWLKNGKTRINTVIRHNGIFDPRDLHYTCVIGKDKFKLIANQEPMRERGYCGGAPEVIVTLVKNGKRIISRTVLGDSCWGNPTINSVEINGPPSNTISVCSSLEGGQAACKKSKLQ